MASGVTETDRCPFAVRPDVTFCDYDCKIPRPKGFWATLRWLFTPPWCMTGAGGAGTGRLPCPRYDAWRRQNKKAKGPTQADCVAHGLMLAATAGAFKKNGW